MPFLRSRLAGVALLATTIVSACAVEVAETSDVDEALESEPVAQALTNPRRQFAVWLDSPARPLNEDYAPDVGYRENVTHVRRTGTGLYQVFLSDLALPFVVPHVVAYGSDNVRCKVHSTGFLDLGSANPRRIVTVKCHTPGGAGANSRFVLHAFDPTDIQGRAAGGIVIASGTATGAFNTQGTVSATRTAAGHYKISLTNLGGGVRGGTVHVTAMGTDSRYCKVDLWGTEAGAPTTQVITVRCFVTTSDTMADSDFVFLYDEEIPTRFNRGAYTLAHRPTTASYAPNTFYTWMRDRTGVQSTSATASLVPSETGHYKMVYHGLTENASWDAYLFVGAQGAGSQYCKIRNWSLVPGCSTNCDIEAHTLCFDKNGAATNTPYVQTWGSFNTLAP